jgi:TetR/AcrR family transcriptional regulator, ethionamide resistance regulator
MKRVPPRPRQASATSATPGDPRSYPFAVKAESARPTSNVELGVFSATESLLQHTPLGDLAVADILTEADVSRTTFYKYFTSKAMVVSAMLLACQAELRDVMRPWSTRGARPADEALREAMDAVAKVWGRHRPVLRAGSESWHSEPEIGQRWVAMMDYFIEDISRQITRERKAGLAPPGVDSLQIARHLAWGGERLLYLAGFGIYGKRYEGDVVDAMVAIWLGAIYKV